MTEDVIVNFDDFKFSYSSVSSFEQCPYSFRLNYIEKVDGVQNFFSQYGSFLHDVMEKYFSRELEIWDLLDFYEEGYYNNVVELPPPFLRNVAVSYYDAGYKLFEEFEFDRSEYEIIHAEDYIVGQDNGVNIIIKPDLILREKESGTILILDFKTSEIKKGKGVDKKKLDGYKKQINIYIHYIWRFKDIEIEKAKLWFLRSNTFYEWDYDPYESLDDTNWFLDTIKKIKEEKEWTAKPENFFCNVLCSAREHCEFRYK